MLDLFPKNQTFLTKTPLAAIEIIYGVNNKIKIKFTGDLFGHVLRFAVYEKIGKPRILEIDQGQKLNFITYQEDNITKSEVILVVDETDSKLIPMLEIPVIDDCCELIPTCFWDLFNISAVPEEIILSGFIQGTPSANGAI
jgi:hypothetical protein